VSAAGKTIVFYDGVCGLCDRLVQFLLRRDHDDAFRFAPLQGELAQRVLPPHGCDPSKLDTVYVIERFDTADERLYARSRAVLRVVGRLGGAWRIADALRVLPAPFTDLVYRVIARVRYRWFGRLDHCAVPRPETAAKFLA
jgi:predicted DCC family thiol-disulfide oxidoreductase YuxK